MSETLSVRHPLLSRERLREGTFLENVIALSRLFRRGQITPAPFSSRVKMAGHRTCVEFRRARARTNDGAGNLFVQSSRTEYHLRDAYVRAHVFYFRRSCSTLLSLTM